MAHPALRPTQRAVYKLRTIRGRLPLVIAIALSLVICTVVIMKIRSRARVVHLVEQLSDPSPDARSAAAKSLTQIGKPAVSMLVYALRNHPNDVREEAAHVLAGIGEPAVPALTECLGAEQESVRYCAAQALGDIGPSADPATSQLDHLRQDPSEQVRRAANAALVRIGSAEALEKVVGEADEQPRNGPQPPPQGQP